MKSTVEQRPAHNSLLTHVTMAWSDLLSPLYQWNPRTIPPCGSYEYLQILVVYDGKASAMAC